MWETRRHGHVYHFLDVTASPGGVCAAGDRGSGVFLRSLDTKRFSSKRVAGFGKIKKRLTATKATEEDQEEAYVDVAYKAAIK